jgi:hypothetical protein
VLSLSDRHRAAGLKRRTESVRRDKPLIDAEARPDAAVYEPFLDTRRAGASADDEAARIRDEDRGVDSGVSLPGPVEHRPGRCAEPRSRPAIESAMDEPDSAAVDRQSCGARALPRRCDHQRRSLIRPGSSVSTTWSVRRRPLHLPRPGSPRSRCRVDAEIGGGGPPSPFRTPDR